MWNERNGIICIVSIYSNSAVLMDLLSTPVNSYHVLIREEIMQRLVLIGDRTTEFQRKQISHGNLQIWIVVIFP